MAVALNIILAIIMISAYGSYAFYERAHNDSGSLVALIQADLSRETVAVNKDTPVESAAPAGMTAQEYAQYIANVNAQVADYRAKAAQESATQVASADPKPAPTSTHVAAKPTPTPTPAPEPKPAPAPAPAPQPQPAAQPQGAFRDGTYTGSSVDVYYGFIQVAAVVSNGRLSNVKILSYPNDRGTSIEINTYALPRLTQEAVAAQSADVSGISGATDTSMGFRESLSAALSQAS